MWLQIQNHNVENMAAIGKEGKSNRVARAFLDEPQLHAL
jgi:hypothetical protein